ncbi:hypothetical protein PR001_g30999 [Phytophthora rubi]|uniref:Uncharacterized protein n=1 Tax=Phytophthora rubi TaxID=129364 RepID=A0A6A3GRZ2_9STRA|nr:hypothetical protein PR001_g30999 [Phytophthora rubi]
MLAMLLSLSPLLLRSPCRCGRAHRNAARRSPVPPPCSPFRHAAVAVLAVNARRAALAVPAAAMPAVLRSPVPAAAMLVVLLSLCRPPPCSPCCSRCPRYCYARRDAVTRLIGMLLDVRNSPPTPCSLFICRLRRHYACRSYARRAAVAAPGAAMLTVKFSAQR